jgi:hypothetical protein
MTDSPGNDHSDKFSSCWSLSDGPDLTFSFVHTDKKIRTYPR